MTTTKDRRASRLATCTHFTGIQHDACDAGVAYDSVRDVSVRPYRWPCLHPDAAISCVKRELPTEEEVDAREREATEALHRGMRAREAIIAASDGRRDGGGSIACPECGQRLNYTIASNGHIWATCSGGCVSWME